MARLDDLLPELKEDPQPSQNNKTEKSQRIVTGLKRRAWINEDIEKELHTQEKGFMNQIHKPELVSSILPKHENAIEKGAMKAVYKPLSLCFADLRSNPLQMFRYLYELAKIEDDNYTTPRVKLREMMLQLNISKDSARTALRFLLKQKFMERVEFQPGQLGWSRYRLKETICKEFEKAILKGAINPFTLSNKEKNRDNVDVETQDHWDLIDISPLENSGFNRKHLLQIKTKTTPEIVQESINHFAYALKYNSKVKEYSNPIATLISVLKRGEAWIEPNYQSPQELAQQKFLELKKAELERKKSLEEELYKIALDEWMHTLSQEDIDEIAPVHKKQGDLTPRNAKLSIYFKERVWPGKRKDYLS